MPVSCGRGLSSEKITSSPFTKYSTPKNPVAAEGIDDLRRHLLRRLQRGIGHRGGLPALAIIAAFLAMADRRTKADAVLVAYGEQRDLVIEIDERLGNHAQPVAAHPAAA